MGHQHVPGDIVGTRDTVQRSRSDPGRERRQGPTRPLSQRERSPVSSAVKYFTTSVVLRCFNLLSNFMRADVADERERLAEQVASDVGERVDATESDEARHLRGG